MSSTPPPSDQGPPKIPENIFDLPPEVRVEIYKKIDFIDVDSCIQARAMNQTQYIQEKYAIFSQIVAHKTHLDRKEVRFVLKMAKAQNIRQADVFKNSQFASVRSIAIDKNLSANDLRLLNQMLPNLEGFEFFEISFKVDQWKFLQETFLNLNNFTALTFNSCTVPSDVTQLMQSMTKVKSLTIEDSNIALDNLLVYLINLEHIQSSQTSLFLFPIDHLYQHPRLQSIKVGAVLELDRFFLVKPKKLEVFELQVRNVHHLNDLNPLVNLQRLRLRGLSDFKEDMSPITRLAHLKHLSIDAWDFDFLKSMSQLESLEVCLTSNFHTVPLLGHMEHLKRLIIVGDSSRINLNIIRDNQELELLKITNNTVMDISPLTNKKNLKTLNLSWKSNIQDYSPLSTCINLVELDLVQYQEKVKNLEFLRPLNQLKKLSLFGFNSAVDLSPLVDLKSLNEIDLQHCENLNNLDFAEQLPNLRHISILEVHRIDLDQIARLQKRMTIEIVQIY